MAAKVPASEFPSVKMFGRVVDRRDGDSCDVSAFNVCAQAAEARPPRLRAGSRMFGLRV